MQSGMKLVGLCQLADWKVADYWSCLLRGAMEVVRASGACLAQVLSVAALLHQSAVGKNIHLQ